MATHYDTLGVPLGASPAEIRAGYRKAAAAAHPDREGGSTGAMQRVNAAHECLSDPERRARYDATGDDADLPPLQARGEAMLRELFLHLLDAVDNPVGAARAKLRDLRDEAGQKKSSCAEQVKRLEKRRDRVKVKEGAKNLVHHLIDHKVHDLNQTAAKMVEVLSDAAEALRQLDAYEFVPEQRPDGPIHSNQYLSGMIGGGWRMA